MHSRVLLIRTYPASTVLSCTTSSTTTQYEWDVERRDSPIIGSGTLQCQLWACAAITEVQSWEPQATAKLPCERRRQPPQGCARL